MDSGYNLKAEPTGLTDRLIRYGVRNISIKNETSVCSLNNWKNSGALYKDGGFEPAKKGVSIKFKMLIKQVSEDIK